MSTNFDGVPLEPSGFPELTELGKRLEVIRIGRGLSKQHLARVAGTSRQQLWRVMTGKSELTDALRQRLAEVLHVEPGSLSAKGGGTVWSSAPSMTQALTGSIGIERRLTLQEYLADTGRLERTIRSLPVGDSGRDLKRALLNALEDQAIAHRITLDSAFFDLRRRVLAGEL